MTKTKRLFIPVLLAAMMLFGLLPISAFAAQQGASVYAVHYSVSSEQSLYDTDAQTNAKLTPTQEFDSSLCTISEGTTTQSLWVYSSTMTAEEQSAGNVVPYVDDASNTRWYLNEIRWFNDTASNSKDATNSDSYVIMTAAQIKAATSTEAYSFDLNTKITGNPDTSVEEDPAYYIEYWWTTTSPDQWGEPVTPPEEKTEYTISYDVNRPEGSTILPVQTQDGVAALSPMGDVTDTTLTTEEQVGELTTQVTQDSNFTVGKARYTDFFAYTENSNGTDSYWAFAGWQDKASNIHKQGDSVKATSDLAGEDNKITLTGQWTQISALPETVSKDALKSALDESITPVVVNTNLSREVLAQWSDTDDNKSDGRYNKGTVLEVDESSVLNYQVTGNLNKNIIGKAGDTTAVGDQKIGDLIDKLDITVTPDSKLTLADAAVGADGKVTFTFSSPYLYPTGLKADGTAVSATVSDSSGAAVTASPASNGSPYTITVAASDIENQDGSVKPLTFSLDWRSDKYTTDDITGKNAELTIGGFTMKLRDGAVTDKATFEVVTGGKAESEIDLSKWGNLIGRYRYQTVFSILYGNKDLQSLLGGSIDNPTAYAYALIAVEDYLNGESGTVTQLNDAKATYAKAAYTVVSEYYTNGTLDGKTETTCADSEKVYVGDTKALDDIAQTAAYTPEGGTEHTYTYTPTGSKTSVVIDKDAAKNVLTLRYARTVYAIDASAGSNGTIDPAGSVSVEAGAEPTFTITPADGYKIADVKVDGESVGAVTSYTFKPVAANHSITASFTKIESATATPAPAATATPAPAATATPAPAAAATSAPTAAPTAQPTATPAPAVTVPQTGDEFPYAALLATLLAAAAGFGYTVYRKRKDR